MHTTIVTDMKFQISPLSVLKRMGRGVSKNKWMKRVSQICEEFSPHIHPLGVYREAFCSPNGEAIEFDKEYRLESRFLRDNLPKPQNAAIFLITIGSELEQKIREDMRRGRSQRAFILDCLSSNAAEKTAATLQKTVQESLGLPMKRYSPGYNDWDISQQEILFEFLGEKTTNNIGVSLTDDFMMTPRKSVSGIILPR